MTYWGEGKEWGEGRHADAVILQDEKQEKSMDREAKRASGKLRESMGREAKRSS